MKRTIFSLVSLIPLTFAACGGSDSGDCTASGGTNKAQYVVNTVLVPTTSAKDYGIDLNGDTRVDNQLGQIIVTLAGQGLNVQDGVNQALMGGSLILLLGESSTDAAFQSDSCGTTTLQLGTKVTGAPDFSGMGHFTPDGTQPASTFNGPITGGKFNSAPPATTTHPVTAGVTLPLVAGQTPVPIILQGAHLQYTRSSAGMVTGGQLQGGIKSTDVQLHIVPAVASLLTNKLQTDNPQTSTDMQISSLFDTGGKADPACAAGTCKNPTDGDGDPARKGMCAVKGDKIIDVCEVSTNGLVTNLLAPDVQLFNSAGMYAPNKDNTMKDSLSVGLGFTAVGATF
ncbi:MAG TPA: hypothetical protein VF997_08275 [Polyangia bacterium]